MLKMFQIFGVLEWFFFMSYDVKSLKCYYKQLMLRCFSLSLG